MTRSFRVWSALVVMFACTAVAAGAEKSVEIKAKPDGKVAAQDDISGKLLVEGLPIVLVRAADDKEWWIQPAVELLDKGEFKAKARFGNAKTPAGTKFAIKVVVARNADEAAIFKKKETVTALPEGLLSSQEVIVTLDRAGATAAPAATPSTPAKSSTGVIASPTSNGNVRNKHEVSGKAGDAFPVILVRSSEAGELWWVQEPAEKAANGTFQANARFGNEKTAVGAEFQIVVLLYAASKDAEALPVGSSFKELPSGVRQSEVLKVKLERPADDAK